MYACYYGIQLYTRLLFHTTILIDCSYSVNFKFFIKTITFLSRILTCRNNTPAIVFCLKRNFDQRNEDFNDYQNIFILPLLLKNIYPKKWSTIQMHIALEQFRAV